MPRVSVGKGCRISRAILDEGCRVPDGTVIGDDPERDAERFHVTAQGVVLVTEDMLRRAHKPTSEIEATKPELEGQAVSD
jgi:glucose-1-phosphate adenylyltransferase